VNEGFIPQRETNFLSLGGDREELTECKTRFTRKRFDYIIFGLFLIYGTSIGMFAIAKFRFGVWVHWLRILWPGLVACDVVMLVSGWVAGWRDEGGVALV